MESVFMQEYKIPLKGIKRKVLYHFSDCHLTEHDQFSNDEERAYAIQRTNDWENIRQEFAEKYHEPYGTLQQQSAAAHLQNAVACVADGDGVILAGDVLDYISGGNIRAAEAVLASVKPPMLAVRGNHESNGELPDTGCLSGMKKSVQVIDLEDLLLVGIDNATRTISKAQNEKLRTLLSGKKPVVLAMHVPVMTEGNRGLLEESGEYFQLNYEGCPEENLEFLAILKEYAGNLVAVLAGHLHYHNVSMLPGGVPQYVSSQGVAGNLYRYIIGE